MCSNEEIEELIRQNDINARLNNKQGCYLAIKSLMDNIKTMHNEISRSDIIEEIPKITMLIYKDIYSIDERYASIAWGIDLMNNYSEILNCINHTLNFYKNQRLMIVNMYMPFALSYMTFMLNVRDSINILTDKKYFNDFSKISSADTTIDIFNEYKHRELSFVNKIVDGHNSIFNDNYTWMPDYRKYVKHTNNTMDNINLISRVFRLNNMQSEIFQEEMTRIHTKLIESSKIIDDIIIRMNSRE